MTDANTRSLERAASAGDLDAHARLLVERRRAGELSLARLRLAAYAGNAAAEFAYGREECHKARWRKECTFSGWLQGILALGADLDVGEWEERCPAIGDCRHGCAGKPGCDAMGTRLVPWPGSEWLGLRCSIVAGRVAAEVADEKWECPHGGYHEGGECTGPPAAPHRALDAAHRYLNSGLLEDRGEWGERWADATGPGLREGPTWLPAPGYQATIHISAAAREAADMCSGCNGIGADYGDCCGRCNATGRVGGKSRVYETMCADLIGWALG